MATSLTSQLRNSFELRLRIHNRLLLSGPATASELARQFQCLQPRVWRNLNVLLQAGLVEKQWKNGKECVYVAKAMSQNGEAPGSHP